VEVKVNPPHHVGDVVGTQAVRAERARQDEPPSGIEIQTQQMELRPGKKPCGQLVKGRRNGRTENRAGHPGSQDPHQRIHVGDGLAEDVPADDGAYDGLSDGDR